MKILNHPFFISIGIIASILALITFFSGKQYFKEYLDDTPPVPPSKAYFDKATFYLNSNLLDSAILYFDKFLLLEPQSAEGYFYRGQCYLKKEAPEKAMDNYSQALKIQPNYILALQGVAVIESCKLQFGVAKDHLDRILQIDSNNLEALRLKGRIHLYTPDEEEEAKVVFEKMVRLEPNNGDFRYLLNLSILHELHTMEVNTLLFGKLIKPDFLDQKYNEVISSFDTTINLHMNSHYYLARAKVKLSHAVFRQRYIEHKENSADFDNALTDLRYAISLDSVYREAYFYKGVARALQGNSKEAEKDWEIARRLGLEIDFEDNNIKGLSKGQDPDFYLTNFGFLWWKKKFPEMFKEQ